jgi:hypothetical protein
MGFIDGFVNSIVIVIEAITTIKVVITVIKARFFIVLVVITVIIIESTIIQNVIGLEVFLIIVTMLKLKLNLQHFSLN